MKAMEHNNSGGSFATTLSIIGALFAWVTIKDVQVFFAIAASAVAIISGFYAIRYYRKQLKNKS